MTQENTAPATLHAKLLAIQSELKAPKEHKSPMGYSYRSCEDILEGLKPLLKEQGLVLILSDEIVLIGARFYVKATATLSNGSTEPGDISVIQATAYAREVEEKRGTDPEKLTGAASSYARKYALNGLFCIDDTKDADATGQPQEQAKKQPTPKATPKPVLANQAQLSRIDQLCQETDTSLTDLRKLYKLQGEDIPTDAQAQAMIASLLKKKEKLAAKAEPEAPSTSAA